MPASHGEPGGSPPHCRACRGGGARAERDLEAAVHLVLQTQLRKGREGAAELRQSPEPLTTGQCPSSDQGEAWGLFLALDWRQRGPLSPERVPGSSWALDCPRLGLPTSSGPLVENAALTLPNTPALPVSPARPPDRGCMLSHRGGSRAGVHGHLPSAGQQRGGVQPAGAAQPRAQRHQPAR